MSKIRVSTDSTADIPQAIRKELDIVTLPLTILAEGKEYRDGVDIEPGAFYELMERCADIPGTAQVSVTLYTALFEETLAAGFTHLIHVSINSKGSGTYQAGLMARDMFYEEHPEARDALDIQLLDSANYSMAYGLAVVEGARLAKNGAAPQEVLAHVTDWLEHGRAIVVPFTLKYVKKSGRVSPAAAFVGDALGLKPLITFEEGEPKIPAKVRGEAKAVTALVDRMLQTRKPGTPYALAYGSNESLRTQLREACAQVMDLPPVAEYPLGCVISINTGPEAVGLCYYHA